MVFELGEGGDSRGTMDRRSLTERDICTKFILPALKRAGWDEMLQIREEVYFTNGRIIVRGKLVSRGKAKKADFVLYYKPNIPIALIEAKDNNHSVGHGIQLWRLWKAGRKKRILFLAERNVLINQTMVNDFRPFAVAPHSFVPALAKQLVGLLNHRFALGPHLRG